MAGELWTRDALDLAGLIREGEASSREVVESHLERIGEVNGHVNAVVAVLADEALAAADAADRAVADGDELGPLHGVPCTVKENIDVAGTPTTSGVEALAEAVASVDAPTVERLRAAGAIPIGRTNLPDLGLRVNTVSQLHGATRNPHDPTRTVGGSSGGEGAALATGMSPLGLGNDLGGSLRNPAHCCGIAAIKPSLGAVPHGSVIPPRDRHLSLQLMAAQGVMARRVADVRAGFEAVAGEHVRDPLSAPLRLHEPTEGPQRIAVLPEPPRGDTHPGIAASVRRCADLLADAGHEVVEATPPDYERALSLWGDILMTDIHHLRGQLEPVMGEQARRYLAGALQGESPLDLAGFLDAQTERYRIARHWAEWHTEHPLLLSPIWTQPAFPLDFDVATPEGPAQVTNLLRPVMPSNLLGTPAVAVPVGFVEELPVALQVMGPKHADLRCLDLAEQIELVVDVQLPVDPVQLSG